MKYLIILLLYTLHFGGYLVVQNDLLNGENTKNNKLISQSSRARIKCIVGIDQDGEINYYRIIISVTFWRFFCLSE